MLSSHVQKNPQNSHLPIAICKVGMLYLTVRRLIASNKLVASRIGGRSLRIKKEDIDTYLAEHTNKEKGVAINE